MANIYVRSTTGSDSNNGSTWALAKATIAGAMAIDAAGDNIYVSQAHSETAGTTNWAIAGIPANPSKMLSVLDTSEPPVSYSSGAILACTGTTLSWTSGAGYYVNGFIFNVGTGTSLTVYRLNARGRCVYENCHFNYVSNNASTQVSFSSDAQTSPASDLQFSTISELKNCTIKMASSSQVALQAGIGSLLMTGGGLDPAGAACGYFLCYGSAGMATFSGVDLSAGATGMNLIYQYYTGALTKFRNCKLPSGWTGVLSDSAVPFGSRAEMHNCDSGNTNYRLWVDDYFGTIRSETSIVKSGGANDGTVGFSWKMTSNSTASEVLRGLVSVELPARWNTVVGTPITVTVDILRDSATALLDSEVFVEIEYGGTSGYPLSSFMGDGRASLLSTPANQDVSTATWTTTGMTNPNKQKLNVTFTPQQVGYLQGKVFLTKPSTTIYVDPKMVVT